MDTEKPRCEPINTFLELWTNCCLRLCKFEVGFDVYLQINLEKASGAHAPSLEEVQGYFSGVVWIIIGMNLSAYAVKF